jgi:predicted flap endonuclease-1-like 5' DNA nuclease
MGLHRRVHPLDIKSGKEIRMRAFKVFIFGLLYGWFLKIAFDRIFRDNEFADVRNENTSLREYILALETQLQSKSLGSKSAQPPQIHLQAEPKAVAASAPEPLAPGTEKDNLKAIKGIGPAIEKKLNNAGVHTFSALSKLSKKELEAILGSQVKRLQDENDLIAQAKQLARRK